jgi:hypothetical protein
MLCAACVWMFQKPSKEGNHHHSYDNLAKAAKSGCRICIYLQMLRQKTGPDELEEMKHPFTTYFFQAWRAEGNLAAYFLLEIQSDASWIRDELYSASVQIRLHVSNPVLSPQWWPQYLAGVNQDLQARSWKVRDNLFDTRLIPESTGDPKVMELGLKWLGTCQNFHTQCEAIDETRQQGYFPSRLLDVGTPECGTVRLIRTDVEPPVKGSRYATLSHCWGQHVPFIRLTADSMASLMTLIPPESLPRSFEDAMITCRRLRIRFLWIDSLCILQSGPGSEEDWQYHVREMHVIYANCVLDIVIAHASNPDEGAFVTRNPAFIRTAQVYAPVKMDLHEPQACVNRARQYEGEGGNTEMVDIASVLDDVHLKRDDGTKTSHQPECCLVTIFIPEFDWSSSLFDQPLWKRGWVFQERLMAPRMLVFGNDRIYWQCYERMVNEYLPHGIPGSGDIYDEYPRTPFTLPKLVLRLKPPSTLTDEEFSYLHCEWYSLVDYYSITQLTYPAKDKLAALAAVAGRFGRIFPGKYCAGLFEIDLPLGLLWEQPSYHSTADAHWKIIERSLVITFDRDRGAECGAPTWSWASVDGRTAFWTPRYAHENHIFQVSSRMLATLDEVSIELKDFENPYGQVVSGELVISGTLIPLIHTDQEISLDYADVDVPQEREPRLFALCILEQIRGDDDKDRTETKSSVLKGVVLSQCGENSYQRKGYFVSDGPLNSTRFLTETYAKKTIRIVKFIQGVGQLSILCRFIYFRSLLLSGSASA